MSRSLKISVTSNFVRREFLQEIVQHEEGMISAIDVFHHKGRQFEFLDAGAAIEKNLAARFDQLLKFRKHTGVIGQVLDHTHDHDRIELPVRRIFQQIANLNIPVEAKRFCARVEIAL